jgi:hypothetical protein
VPAGYQLVWSGQYELMERVKERLKIVVPITLFKEYRVVSSDSRPSGRRIVGSVAQKVYRADQHGREFLDQSNHPLAAAADEPFLTTR